MVKKKRKTTKKQPKQLPRYAKVLAVGVVGLAIGMLAIWFLQLDGRREQPLNIVWAADNTVTIPTSLRTFLTAQSDCNHYKGTNSPQGVGLWGVYQVSEEKFAKIAYGCSWNLTNYIMAVKQGSMWRLVPPTEYFAPFQDATQTGNGAIPKCSQIQKYKISKTIEPFCIKDDGSATLNEL